MLSKLWNSQNRLCWLSTRCPTPLWGLVAQPCAPLSPSASEAGVHPSLCTALTGEATGCIGSFVPVCNPILLSSTGGKCSLLLVWDAAFGEPAAAGTLQPPLREQHTVLRLVEGCNALKTPLTAPTLPSPVFLQHTTLPFRMLQGNLCALQKRNWLAAATTAPQDLP